MTTRLSVPLVGMHFNPPAKQVLGVLASGCQLLLVPEPENPYDEKAIKVYLVPGQIGPEWHEELAQLLLGTGSDLTDVLGDAPLMLGHIGDSDGKICKAINSPGNREAKLAMDQGSYTANLSFGPDGKPLVTITNEGH